MTATQKNLRPLQIINKKTATKKRKEEKISRYTETLQEIRNQFYQD